MADAPLWKQLVVVWAGALALAVTLLVADLWFARPREYFWLLPYPTRIRDVLGLAGQIFRARPLTASAIVGVPVVAVLTSVALVTVWVVRSLSRAQ